MQRFTISLDDDLAQQFDAFIADKGYVNRSEAVRDLIRSRLGESPLEPRSAKAKARAQWCVASLSFVYDHHDQTVTMRVLDLQHQHHDLVVTTLHTHLDHHHCLETAVLRGTVERVRALADQVIALKGVRHGEVHVVLLDADSTRHSHHHGGDVHTHFTPHN